LITSNDTALNAVPAEKEMNSMNRKTGQTKIILNR